MRKESGKPLHFFKLTLTPLIDISTVSSVDSCHKTFYTGKLYCDDKLEYFFIDQPSLIFEG